GEPKVIYDKPENMFVASFIGSPSMNFLEGKLDEGHFVIGETAFKVPQDKLNALRKQGYEGKKVILGIRPEDVNYLKEESLEQPTITSTVDVVELMGAETYLYSSLRGQNFVARVDSDLNIKTGNKITFV